MNELIYLLLNYSNEEEFLFEKYAFILKNINEINYKYLLRMFELELLDSLGQGVYVDCDVDGVLIDESLNYSIYATGFKRTLSSIPNSIVGKSLLKISQSVSSWTAEDLKAISKVTRAHIDYALAGKQLKSRKLLIDYLNLGKK
ncbi:DNA recombination and repair protein RecO [Francisella salina]|uniref:DNA recombination and repair protein RecO n=2 Tax=Francisella salina TaxID=573569 RepID=A0ABM5M9Y3_FRAST|nr:DNA recombination and repair protein RecO [Francisella salina]